MIVSLDGAIALPVQSQDSSAEVAHIAAPGTALPSLARLRFDSYINTFHELFWAEFTSVSTICLEIEIEGIVQVEVLRHAPAFGVTVPVHKVLGAEGARTRHSISVPAKGLGAGAGNPTLGRLWCTFEGQSDDARYLGGRWATAGKPRNSARLALVTCIDQDRAAFYAHAAAFATVSTVDPTWRRLVAADRGRFDLTEELELAGINASSAAAGKLAVVDCNTLDKAAAMDAAMAQALAGNGITHVVALDAGVTVNAAALLRLSALVRYARTDIGLQMPLFDSLHPGTWLDGHHYAHADRVLGPHTRPLGYDMGLAGANDVFCKIDYNNHRQGHGSAFGIMCLSKDNVAYLKSVTPPGATGTETLLRKAVMAIHYPFVEFPGLYGFQDVAVREKSLKRPFPLQELQLPDWGGEDHRPESMFVTLHGPVQKTFRSPQQKRHIGFDGWANGAGPVGLPGEALLSFDSYLNTFYERYWLDFTIVDQICLEIEVEGVVRVEVLRHAPANGCVTSAADVTVGQPGLRTRHVVKVMRPQQNVAQFPTYAGRIWCVVSGRSADARYLSGRWATPLAPKNDPRVAIAMCTFNKSGEVVRNLNEVALAFAKEPALYRFIVVDQGDKQVAAEPGFAKAAEALHGKLQMVQQGNLGGAGGFTRGMMEGFKDPVTTDVLLMDDDVVVDPTVLITLSSLLRYVKSPTMIGGQMFDLFYRNILFAHAERANFAQLHYEPITPHGIDMSQPGSNDLFIETITGTYNGWWMCNIPRSAVEKHGLGLPCFVRCDDSEYGTRLTSNGFPFVTFPGVYIWHEPFYAKISAWMLYYEHRNFLAMANMREGVGTSTRQKAYQNKFEKYIFTNLFDHAHAMIVALEHYLEGPDSIYTDTLRRHKEVLKDMGTLKPVTTRGSGFNIHHELPSHLPGSPDSNVNRARKLWWNLVSAPSADRPREAGPKVGLGLFTAATTYKRDEVIVYNHYTTESYRLRPDPKLARQLTLRMMKAMRRWNANRVAISDAYVKALPKVASADNWCAYLGLKREDYAALKTPDQS